MNKFIRILAGLAIAFTAFVMLVLLGPREIGIYIFESGAMRDKHLATVRSYSTANSECHSKLIPNEDGVMGEGKEFDKCWDAVLAREVAKRLAHK